MPRRKKDLLIPEVPPDESLVQKAISKTKQSKKTKTAPVIEPAKDDYISDDSDSETEFSIVSIKPVVEQQIAPPPEIAPPKIKKPKKVKAPKIAPIIPLDSFIHQQGSGQSEINLLQQQIMEEEKKRYSIYLQKLQKENEALKEVKQYSSHLNTIDSLSRRMKIDF